MEYLAPPFLILRRGMIQGNVYPHIDEHIAEFMATSMFHTSLLYLDSATYRQNVAKYTNNEMCRLTEQVIFTEPFTSASNNNYNKLIEEDVKDLQADPQAKAAAAFLKSLFVTSAEALTHGDLHTGSIMVTPVHTKMIDPEFGYYGPVAFDLGKILGNFLLSLFASYGQEVDEPSIPRSEQRAWIISSFRGTYAKFVAKFRALWDTKGLKGDLAPDSFVGPNAPGSAAGLPAIQDHYFRRLFPSAMGFAGCCMVRRIVGIAGVADLRGIKDEQVRAGCERRALRFGRMLLGQVITQTVRDIDEVTHAAVAAAAAK